MSRPDSLRILACQLCQNPAFWRFCNARDEAGAKEFILRTCGITSRNDLDTNPKAAHLFHEHVRMPFAYRKAA